MDPWLWRRHYRWEGEGATKERMGKGEGQKARKEGLERGVERQIGGYWGPLLQGRHSMWVEVDGGGAFRGNEQGAAVKRKAAVAVKRKAAREGAGGAEGGGEQGEDAMGAEGA